ncbi:variable surface protein [Plasmodium gonderi]|uniref:Variable surface protein n=1 Tax=Plasmodium gonderi TaxID=77519 RepID=A0A1Y1JWW8_PLAGO|nr:variable surface protein [Plasmodium gonderi]GAW84314.1 variable surface protein [Plasmodium gonderi]
MEKKFFEYVNYFPECEKIMQTILNEGGGDDFTHGFYQKHGIKEDIFKEKKYCGVAMLYVRDIDEKSDSFKITKESGFSYLLYWLYNKISEDEENTVIKVYKALLEDHKKTFEKSKCMDYIDYTISKEHINGIDKMISMYECLNKMKSKVRFSEKDSLCSAVPEFIKRYNAEIESETAKSQQSTLSDECKNNTRISIIIIIILALLISTQLGSHFRSLLAKNGNYWNNVNQEKNNIQPPNITECGKNYNKYDILYHCDYFIH